MREATTPTRRMVLRGGAASALAGSTPIVTTVAGLAFAVAFADWERLRQRFDEASLAEDAAYDRHVAPDLPPYNMQTDVGGYVRVPAGENRAWIKVDPSDENIAELRDEIRSVPASGGEETIAFAKRRAERAKATLAKIEAYRAENDRLEMAAGIPAAREAVRAAGFALDAKSEEILAMTPRTIREWAMQARIILQAGMKAERFLERLSAAGLAA